MHSPFRKRGVILASLFFNLSAFQGAISAAVVLFASAAMATGSRVQAATISFFCAGLPPTRMGVSPRSLHMMEVAIPAQPQDSSSTTIEPRCAGPPASPSSARSTATKPRARCTA